MEDKLTAIADVIEAQGEGLSAEQYDELMLLVVKDILDKSGLKMESRIVGGGKQINLKH